MKNTRFTGIDGKIYIVEHLTYSHVPGVYAEVFGRGMFTEDRIECKLQFYKMGDKDTGPKYATYAECATRGEGAKRAFKKAMTDENVYYA